MENKPQNVFEKLDNQGEKIDDISQKLEGISINDLYALAKRTWDYGDYQTAQKYYNHISLLKPLDWEAPLYASLCNFRGYHDMFFWTKVPEQTHKIIVSTIKYIYNLDLDNKKKEYEMSKCIEIIKDFMIGTKEHYFKYKDNYDRVNLNFIYDLEDYYLNVYNDINSIHLDSIKEFSVVLVDALLEIITKTSKITNKLTKDSFLKFVDLSEKEYNIDYDTIMKSNKVIPIEPIIKLSDEEIKEIKLKGKMYYEEKDKVISKRIFERRLAFGLFFIITTLFAMISNIACKKTYAFIYTVPLIYGVYLTAKAFMQKDRIYCNSFVNIGKMRNRLSSEGEVVMERKIGVPALILTIFALLHMWYYFVMVILILDNLGLTFISIANLISMIVIAIALLCSPKINAEKYPLFRGFKYFYNDKWYEFDK